MPKKNKTGAYWKERFELLEEAQNRTGRECFADIERHYRGALKEIEGKVAVWYQRFAENNNVSMAEARRILSRKELEELKWDVKEYIRYGQENAVSGEWMKELENASARFHISRLEALKLQLRQSVEALYGRQTEQIGAAMRRIYKSGYYHTAYEIQKGCGVGWDFFTLNDKLINRVIHKPWAADGKNFSERIWENRRKLVNEMNTELTRNIILGQDPQKAIDAIAKKMGVSKNVAGRLVMTEEAFFSSAAQKDCFAELRVEKYEIVATLDSKTSEICQEMDGKVFPVSQWEVGVTAPPFHVRCRTTTVPHDDDFEDTGKRAARGKDGKVYYVPSGMKYKDWKKAFVDGDKSGLQKISSDGTIHKKDDVITSVADASGFDELREYMQNTYNIDMTDDVINLDFGTVKQSLIGVESVISEYPEVGDLLKTVEITTAGVMSCTGSSIKFNQAYYGVINDLFDKCLAASQMGAWIKNCTPQTIGAHEAGHGVEWLLIQTNPNYMYDFERELAWKESCEAESIVKEAIQNIKESVYGKGKKREDLIKAISQYACYNASEALAEAFHDVYANGKEANPLSIEIKKITRKRMNRYKGVEHADNS